MDLPDLSNSRSRSGTPSVVESSDGIPTTDAMWMGNLMRHSRLTGMDAIALWITELIGGSTLSWMRDGGSLEK